MIKPKRLAGAATIGLIAPSGLIGDPKLLARTQAYLETAGHKVIVDERLSARWRYFAGDDDARLALIERFVHDPAVDIIMAARGGYGVSRILPRLNFSDIAASRKIFVGFSDFTAFQLACLAKADFITYAGPMAVVDFHREPVNPYAEWHFWELLGASTHTVDEIDCRHSYHSQEIYGRIWGGNLSLIVHLLGTPYFPLIENGILFLEEVNEEPYHVERMLMQLHLSGVLNKQRAVLCGKFTHCKATEASYVAYTIDEAIETIRELLDVPILTDFPFGHVEEKVTVPIGGRARISLTKTGYQVTFMDYNSAY